MQLRRRAACMTTHLWCCLWLSKKNILSLYNECVVFSEKQLHEFDNFSLIVIIEIDDELVNSGEYWLPIDMIKRVGRLYDKHNINEDNFLNSYTNTKY